MTYGPARLASHANGDDRRDRIHQILERLNLEGAIRWSFCRCFVQCVPSFFKATVRLIGCVSLSPFPTSSSRHHAMQRMLYTQGTQVIRGNGASERSGLLLA